MADINDDLTDLTEEESADQPKANKPKVKKEKPEKAEKPKREGKKPSKTAKKSGAKGGAGNVGNRKKSGFALKLILIIVPIVLVAAFVCEEILFNNLGTRDFARDVMVNAVVKLDPEFASVDEELQAKSDEREESLSKRDIDLDRREASIESRISQLDLRENGVIERETAAELWEKQLEKRNKELDEREAHIKQSQIASTPVYHREMTEQELADMQSLSRSYSKMSPESASLILAELEHIEDVASILYFMSERNVAAILAVMEPGFAARLTEILMNS